MFSNSRRYLRYAGVAITAATLAACSSGGGGDDGEGPIKVGHLIGVTGDYAPYYEGSQVGVEIALDDRVIHLDAPVVYAWTDPVQGERTRSFRCSGITLGMKTERTLHRSNTRAASAAKSSS